MKKNVTNEYYELDILQLIKALWNKVWAIVIAAVIFGTGGFVYSSFFITPMYKAEALMYVNNSSFSVGSTSFSISTSELTAAQSLVETYIVILNTRSTLEEVIEVADLDYTYEQMKHIVSANAINNTEVFSISVTTADPEESEYIANVIARILPNKIADVIDGSSVRIVDLAVAPTVKASPNITLFTVVGMIIGMAIACLIIIMLELTDTLIHSEDYLNETYDIPVLAVIPDLLASSESSNYYSGYEKK